MSCAECAAGYGTGSLGASAAPQGQGGPRDGGRGGMQGHQIEFLTKKLNLTPDQVTQVKAIDADTWKQAKALREDTTTADADKRTKMMEIHKASQDKIRALLTDDQQTKFDAMQAEMREHRGTEWRTERLPASTTAQQ